MGCVLSRCGRDVQARAPTDDELLLQRSGHSAPGLRFAEPVEVLQRSGHSAPGLQACGVVQGRMMSRAGNMQYRAIAYEA